MIYTKFCLSLIFQSRDMDLSLLMVKRALQVTESLKRDNIDNLCIRLHLEQTRQILTS